MFSLSLCKAEKKPSSMELQYQDSPWQRVNEETTLHFNPVDRGTRISVSEDHARKLENSNFILSFAHTDYQPDSVWANQPILHWTTTTTKRLKAWMDNMQTTEDKTVSYQRGKTVYLPICDIRPSNTNLGNLE